MYTIEVNFATGNSFGSHDETETIALVWKDKELARKALVTIKEHYEYYEKLNGYNRTTNKQLYRELKKHKWFKQSNKYPNDESMWGYRCAVELDDGSWIDLDVGVWCGYFEQLHNASIVNVNDEQDYISF